MTPLRAAALLVAIVATALAALETPEIRRYLRVKAM